MTHHHPHPCPKTGKCCGRCHRAISGGEAAAASGAGKTEFHAGHGENKHHFSQALSENMDAEVEY